MSDKKNTSLRKEELRSFAFLTVVMAPVLAGALIAAYGFSVWIFQMFAGPPHG
jgi:periplasmic nitrate reductase NapE